MSIHGRLSTSIAHLGGRLHGADVDFVGVGTDSRSGCRGQLFVALHGERFDGHDYVVAATARGAVAAMVDHELDLDLPQWIVDDTRLALGRLAAYWRGRFPGRVVGITGSNGKTTCKEMAAAILSEVGKTRATVGNLNNDIGLPLTLLSAADEDWLILEMGANHPGEIAYLSELARPQAAVITNAGRAHLEGFGSVEGVAHAKGEIARGLPPDGTFVFMADVPWTPLWRELAGGRRCLTFGTGPGADVRADEQALEVAWDDDGFRTRFTVELPDGPLPIELALAGRHNLRNALAAISLTLALDVPGDKIQAGLAAMRPVRRRLQPRLGPAGLRLIDDSYTANPDSLAAAVDVLVELTSAPDAGRALLVLGDFGELGPDSAPLHRAMGADAQAAGVDRLFTVGPLAAQAAAGFGDGAQGYPNQASLIEAVRAEATQNDVVLVKGSRASAMDRVVDALCTDTDGGQQ